MKKFEVGKTYYQRSACNHDCIYSFKIMKRTDKSVTFTDAIGKQYRRKEAQEWLRKNVRASFRPCQRKRMVERALGV